MPDGCPRGTFLTRASAPARVFHFEESNLAACANCGTPLDPDAVFCSRCGLNLTREFKGTAIADMSAEVSETFRRLREALGERYVVESELGRGGMATVFLARDIKHDREVAIKVLHPDLSASIGADRFEREIRLAARLQHPHILGLYDSGNADGLLYYVMPFVKGESLRDRLNREKLLPVDDAIRIALEVCSALGHAHEQGIIHRDIKPENILLSANHALVADFGIARAATEVGQQKLTQTGMAVGTPVYMAPEQSTGDAVGPPADLYSLGCMLYEMLAGEPPFTGPNAMAIMARHLMEVPPSVRVVRSTVPEEIEETIYAALNKAPVDRPQTAAQFAELIGTPLGSTSAMRIMRMTGARRTPTPFGMAAVVRAPVPPRWYQHPAIWGAVAVAGVLVGAFTIWSADAPGSRTTALGENARRVAVLHFTHLARDSALAPLANGLTDGLIRTLSTSPSISVISRSGIEQYRGTTLGVDSIARALRVGFLVRGEVEPEGERVRVSVRLDDASGVRLRSGSFAIARDSILLLQDSLSALAADLIRAQLGAEIRVQAQRAATRSPEAWVLTQRGLQQQRNAEAQRAEGNVAAAEATFLAADTLFAEAEVLDEAWAEPTALRAALAYRRSRLVGREPAAIRPWVTLGIEHADRALSLDPNHADALETRGTLRYWGYLVNLDVDPRRQEAALAAAVSDLERSTEVNRLQASAFATLAAVYATLPTKTTNDVYLAAQRAYETDEFLANASVVLGRLFLAAYDLGNSTAAEEYCRRHQRRFPNDVRAYRCQLYLMTMPTATNPDIARAWRLADSVVARTAAPDTVLARLTARMLIAGALARGSRQEPALADSARRLVAASQGSATIDQPRELAYYGAMVLTILGDGEQAVRLLGTYVAANPQRAAALGEDPTWWFRPIADRPDFQRLTNRAR